MDGNEAITLKDTDILVGLTAGSGKTASLTEHRFVNCQQLLIFRILAVTFTKAAAVELSRISDALRRAA